MTTDLLKLLDELEAKASPRPWIVEDHDGSWNIVGVGSLPCCLSWGSNLERRVKQGHDNAALIVLYVNHGRALVEALEAGDCEYVRQGYRPCGVPEIEGFGARRGCLRCKVLTTLREDLEKALKEVRNG